MVAGGGLCSRKTVLSITPSPCSILPLELLPLVRGRTVPQRKRQHPHPLEKVFFFFCPPTVCHVTSRALADYAECHHLLCSGLEGVRDGKEAEEGEERRGREVEGCRGQERLDWEPC